MASERQVTPTESTRYAHEVTGLDEHEERAGETLVTTDHDVIRQWAETRDATPATVEGTDHEGRPGVLRFDFGDDSTADSALTHISWDEWFKSFDERNLNFLYQEHRTDGSPSNFFRLENPTREDA